MTNKTKATLAILEALAPTHPQFATEETIDRLVRGRAILRRVFGLKCDARRGVVKAAGGIVPNSVGGERKESDD